MRSSPRSNTAVLASRSAQYYAVRVRKTDRSFMERTARFGLGVLVAPYALLGVLMAVVLGLGVLALALGLLVGILQRLGG